MTKHTPGPWSVAGRTGGWDGVDAADGTPICALEYNEPANARVIAAAPELLDMLQAIMRHGELANVPTGSPFASYGGKKPPSKDVFAFPRHMLTDIEAAISKATA